MNPKTMASNPRANRSFDLCTCISVLFATVQLTVGIALPHLGGQTLPVDLPEKISGELVKDIHITDSDVKRIQHITEVEPHKIRDSLQHLADQDVVAQAKDFVGKTLGDFLELDLQGGNQAPSFVTDNFVSSTHTGALIGTRVVTVYAVDYDQGENGRVTYTMEPESDAFALDSSTGIITVSSPPVSKDYTFFVHAKDHGSPPLSSLPAEVTIIVRPLSDQFRPYGDDIVYPDNRPRISRIRRETLTSESATLPENFTINEVVHTISVTGADLRYSMGSPVNEKFAINEQSGEVILLGTLDFETKPLETLNVVITNASNPDMLDTLEVTFTITDADDLPEWTVPISPYITVVPLDVPNAACLYTLSASDQDIETVITYGLLSGGNNMFEVDETSGCILTIVGADTNYVQDEEYILSVYAVGTGPKDGFDGRVSGTVSIFGGSHPPQFTMETYSASVIEAQSSSQVVTQVQAISFTPNVIVQYSIVGPDNRPQHNIDASDGTITLIESVLVEDLPTYFLTVRATEVGGNQQSSDVRVNVVLEDINNCAPTFSQAVISFTNIPETAEIGETVATVTAMDCDSGSNAELTYSITSGDGSFTIDGATGAISPAIALDYEKIPQSYTFEVMAMDGGTPEMSGTVTVVIVIADANEAPVFDPDTYLFRMDELARIGYEIGTVYVSDEDVGAVVTLAFVDPVSNFGINPSTGVITVSQQPTQSSYSFNISATDQQGLSTMALVEILVTDLNDNIPYFPDCTSYRPEVSEDADRKTEVITVSASDGDQGSNSRLTYRISSSGAVNIQQYFAIDQDGVITTVSTLDREVIPEFEVTVEAKDGGSPALTGFCTFTVTVTDVKDRPPGFPLTEYKAIVTSDVDVGYEVITVTASDADLDETLSYSIQSSNSYFTINPSTGVVTTRKNLGDLQVNGQYPDQILSIEATDGIDDSVVPLTIQIRSPDDTTVSVPQYQNLPYMASIREDELIGETFLTVTATEQGNTVGYNIITGLRKDTNSDLTFGLNSVNGSAKIKPLKLLDYEEISQYSLTIVARGQELEALTVATVTIIDINDEIPIFPASTFYANILENMPVNTPIIRIQATDRDVTPAFNQITYSITAGNSDNQFSIDPNTGDIKSEVVFDFESLDSPVIVITVRAFDGLNDNTAQVFISVVDENDNEPIFSGESSFEIAEDAAPGIAVGIVTATDADTSATLEYFISSGNDRGAFSVNSFTGELYVSGILDYETKTSYTLGYSVNDGKNVASTTVTVNVTNVNDVAPQFSQDEYRANVLEEDDSNLPRDIVTVSASDGDVGSTADSIVYNLIGSGAGSIFTIDQNSGNIFVNEVLDRETVAQYNLVAQATDGNGNGLTSYVNVIITVTDINDNEPTFPDQEYVGSVQENKPIGTRVRFVTAEDPDDDALMYSILGTSNEFAIDPLTGEVTTKVQLDRETQDEYVIRVQASDGATQVQTAVIITVTDADDNRPEIIDADYDASVSEAEPVGYTITTLYATDPDIDFRDAVVFFIASGNVNDLFDITTDPATLAGLVQIKRPLDFEASYSKTFTLNIEVTDSQDPLEGQRPPSKSVMITITDANDVVPVFFPVVYSASVSEAAAVGDPVGNIVVSATDEEEPAGALNYLVDPSTDPAEQFAVQASGALVVMNPLDRETVASYELKVWAVDNGTPPLTGTATVMVTVTDVNDTPPEFAEDYNPRVLEGDQQVKTIVTAMAVDRDDPPSGPPFRFSVEGGAWETYFTVQGLGQETNSVNVLTKVANIDREVYPEFNIVFMIAEVGTAEQLTGTSTLTITVDDVNDNPHVATTKNILVYSYEGDNPEVNLGAIPTTPVGQVGVSDPDILEDKTYTIPSGETFPQYFTLDSDSGQITMTGGTPAGTYTMKVQVSDGGTFPDVISTVVVEIRDIPREAVYSSGSIRFSGTTAEQLITPNADGVSKLDQLKTILANAVGAQEENFDIFSVLNVPGMENTVDIRYAAHGSPYYPADQLDLAALSVQDQIADLGLTVAQLPVDLCVKENVCESSCTNVLKVNATPTVVDAGSASFVAVTSYVEAECQCGARMVAPGSCASAPCLNGGTCQDVHGGTYQCDCPYGFDGPDCQQTKRSFKNGFATFSTLRQCEETSLSVEFITEGQSGTLLYNGPIQAIEGDDPIDVILLELVGGQAKLTINLGSTDGSAQNLVLTVPQTGLGDGEWHRIDVYRNGRFVEMTVDRCEQAVVAETSRSSDADYSNCRVSGETPGENKFLNVNTPMFLGGVDPTYTIPRLTVSSGFDGCIKNLVSDGFTFDLARSGSFSNSEAGCPRTDAQCTVNGLPECNNGTCEADLNSFMCICYPGYTGTNCDQELPPYDFAIESYITYALQDNTLYSDSRSSNYQVMVRTRETSGLIWSISNTNTYEYVRMEVVDRYLQVSWHLGDGEISVTLDGFVLSDGAWHAVNFDRYDNVVTIKIDGGGGVKETVNRQSTFSTLDVDPISLVIGARVQASVVSQDLMGCMNDPRINNNFLGMEGTNAYATATKSAGVTEGCPSDVCNSNPCTGDTGCMDYWRLYECECPVGTEPAGGDQCLAINECDSNPCLNGGTCVEVNPTGYNCSCRMGFTGINCETEYATQVNTLGLSTLAWVIMIICLLLILLLLLGLVLYTRQRTRKTALAIAVDAEDDIRENFINYDEEGGGEEDNDAYDLSTLRKPVEAAPVMVKPVKPSEMELVNRNPVPMPMPSDDPNVGDFINERLKGANDDPEGPPYDETHIFDYEGDGSTAGSLSSLNSSSTDSEQNYDYLNDWGPQFRKLADIYGS